MRAPLPRSVWSFSQDDWRRLSRRKPQVIARYLQEMARHETLLHKQDPDLLGGSYDWMCMVVIQAMTDVFRVTARPELLHDGLLELLRTATRPAPASRESTSYGGPSGDVIDTAVPGRALLPEPQSRQRWAIVRRVARLALETGTVINVPQDLRELLRTQASQDSVHLGSGLVLTYNFTSYESFVIGGLHSETD